MSALDAEFSASDVLAMKVAPPSTSAWMIRFDAILVMGVFGCVSEREYIALTDTSVAPILQMGKNSASFYRSNARRNDL